MGHISSPTGGAGPSRGATRRVPSYKTSSRGWADRVIEDLLDSQDVVVDGVLIEGRSLNPRVAVWTQLRKRLAEYGIRTPVEVPDELDSHELWRRQ